MGERTADEAALRALEERLARASEAAERLLAQAREAAAGDGEARTDDGEAPAGDGVPRRGWQRRGEETDPGWVAPQDAELLLAALAAVRDLIPAELAQRLAAALRELLLALRALIDWCLERAERRRTAPDEVQDIPIL